MAAILELTKMCTVADDIIECLNYGVFKVVVNDTAIINLINIKISTVQ